MIAAPVLAGLAGRACTVAGHPSPDEWLGEGRLRAEAASIDLMTGVSA